MRVVNSYLDHTKYNLTHINAIIHQLSRTMMDNIISDNNHPNNELIIARVDDSQG